MTEDKNNFTDLALKYINHITTREEEEELLNILNRYPAYKSKFYNLVKTRALAFSSRIEANKQANFNQLTKRLRKDMFTYNYRKYVQNILLAVAVIVIAVGIGIMANMAVDKKIDHQLTETVIPFGSQCKVLLPDGTVAWLNSGSRLKYSQEFGTKTRDVYLTGEGYFEVAKNPDIPFLVHTQHIKLQVIGTTFNIRAYLEDPSTEINLIEGKVSVFSIENNQTVTLNPNERMIYTKRSRVMSIGKSNASEAALWTTGKLAFVDETIQEITNKLERKFDMQIILESEQLKHEIFSGSLDMNQPITDILDYLDVDKKYKKQYNGKRIVITN